MQSYINHIDEFKDDYSHKALVLLICTYSQTFLDYLAEVAFKLPTRHTVLFRKIAPKSGPSLPPCLYIFQTNVYWLLLPLPTLVCR